MSSFKCTSCGNSTEVETFGRINVADDPALKERVKDGSLFLWECPHCGARNLALYPSLYHDPDQKLMVWLLPAGAMAGDQVAAVEASLSSQLGELEGYTLRRVPDIGSLIEKVNIADCGLDDMVIEMCKYVTRMELAEKDKAGAEAIMDAKFRFYRMEGADNEITLSFPKDGRMNGVNIGFNVYEDCSAILSRNPSVTAGKGFATIDEEWLARFFR
ncbi:MAG: CpXC domain-containing protein [Bacteroidales bacterium]|nr:CpXC domain-containing protein [Bacteroidales bacterium]